MQVQKTHVSQSAAGALLAALAKSDKTDSAAFQQQFAASVEAVQPRRDRASHHDDAAERDVADRSTSTDRRDRRADAMAEAQRTESRERPERADVQSEDRAEQTRPATDSGAADAQADTRPAASDDAQPVQDKAVSDQDARDAQADKAAKADSSDVAAPVNETPKAQAVEAARTAQAMLRALASAGQVTPVEITTAATNDGETAPVAERAAGAQHRKAQVQVAAQTEQTTDATDDVPAVKQPTVDEGAETDSGLQARHAQVHKMAVPAAAQTDDTSGGKSQTESKPQHPDAQVQLKAAHQDSAPRAQGAAAQAPAVHAQTVSISLVQQATQSSLGEQSEVQSDLATVRHPGAVSQSRLAAPAAAAREAAADRPAAEQGAQIERIARIIRASLGRGGSRVSLQLEPRDLGPLRVLMQLRGGDLVARFETQTEAARQHLQDGLGQLRETLAAGGVRLVDATIETTGGDTDAYGASGGAASGFADNPGPGAEQEQGHSGGAEPASAGETDRPFWAEAPADDDALNVVA